MGDFDKVLLRVLVILVSAWAGWITVFLKDYQREQQQHQREVERKMDSIKATIGGARLPDANRPRPAGKDSPPVPQG